MEHKKELVVSIVGVLVLIIVVIGISYAVWSRTFLGTQENSINTGYISFSYTESDTNTIEIHNAIPISDSNGKMLSGNKNMFDFTVSAKFSGLSSVAYEIYATPIVQTLDSKYIKVYLTDQQDQPVGDRYKENSIPTYDMLENSSVTGSKTIYKSELNESGKAVDYRLRIWLSSEYNMPETAKNFAFKVNVVGVA